MRSMDKDDATLAASLRDDSDFDAAMALLTPSADVKQLLPSLGVLLGESLHPFLCAVVAKEVQEAAETPSIELFRANSPGMRLLSEFSYLVGDAYFRSVLLAPLESLYDSSESYEVNENVSLDVLSANQARLQATAQAILDSLLAAECPAPLARVCLAFRRCVATTFHTYTDAALGGFLFLRVLCPAVVVPAKVRLFPGRPMPPIARRATVLVAKLLQNLANNVLFGAKEEYMTPFNGFIRKNYAAVVALYDRICASTTEVAPYTLPTSMSLPAALEVVKRERAKAAPINKTELLLAQSTEPTVLMSAPIDRSSHTSHRQSNVRDRTSQLTRTFGTFVQRSSTFFMTSRGEGSSTRAETTRHGPLPWRDVKARMGSLNTNDVRLRHSQYMDCIQRGVAYLTTASAENDDASSWRPLKQKHGVQLWTRDVQNISEVRASVLVRTDKKVCFSYLCSSRGRKTWGPGWNYERYRCPSHVLEVELVDHTTRVLYKSTNGSSRLWSFSADLDIALLESAGYDADRPATLVFQSVSRSDVPPVQGCTRVELRASGFVLRGEGPAETRLSVVYRSDMGQHARWTKHALALARVKLDLET
ncbi:hypothetical protein SPRG_10548 [Saprolegnia parasitica CBS 223.65]|uniref:Ras-GAP domain-containing protein n=1 Tax=Saprolegnia parasitica (strain CBS 223.65) TaxID=695850 RepID=A0A067CB72_SAPPC|nr:hypothetical protein SPRG_10548 [Saprolegnia parasitica CBS 223.65]KDO23771.1 hypothetical protein SPRG_10548 [Saprolegnia parasitica CBS 223.65]|eukprot:XP_012205586.1 hypothetical protein SPRG_10548 [Saprolegnia parasitica CBS 223.65]